MFDGTSGEDSFLLQAGGDDTASGGDGDDGFYFGAALTSADAVDGGNGKDTLALQGDYTAGLTLGDIRNVEVMLLLSGSDTSFGETGANRYGYDITTNDANIAAGQTLTVIATGAPVEREIPASTLRRRTAASTSIPAPASTISSAVPSRTASSSVRTATSPATIASTARAVRIRSPCVATTPPLAGKS